MNYTANLTEERDELNANLEEAKKALQREMATRIALESKGHMLQGRKVNGICSRLLTDTAVPMYVCRSFDVGFRRHDGTGRGWSVYICNLNVLSSDVERFWLGLKNKENVFK